MDWYNKLWSYSVELFRNMEIPVRQLECCSGDLADLKVKSCDIEAWSPRQQKYFEVCSCSNHVIKTRRIKEGNRMRTHWNPKIELFNAFSQPVILVREGKVVYANHAAAACGIDAAQDAGEFVEEADEGLRLRLGSISRARAAAAFDAVLYIADEYWEAQFRPTRS